MRKKKNNLKVFYGFTKLTPKVMRKPQLAIWFENSNHNSIKNLEFINRRMKVVYTRFQSKEEMEAAEGCNRMFVQYGYFIDEKPWNGSIEQVLEQNFLADENHVSKKEREVIREQLRKEFYSFYNRERKPFGQQKFIFN